MFIEHNMHPKLKGTFEVVDHKPDHYKDGRDIESKYSISKLKPCFIINSQLESINNVY